MTNPEKDHSPSSEGERHAKGIPQTALHERIVSLLEHLESKSRTEETATLKELSLLVRMLITENSEQKETIRKLREKEAEIYEVLRTKLGINL